jgi:hypothetical protein
MLPREAAVCLSGGVGEVFRLEEAWERNFDVRTVDVWIGKDGAPIVQPAGQTDTPEPRATWREAHRQ